MSGINNSVHYRARFWGPSTGQEEMAKVAALLAGKHNMPIMDELTAHLDPTTARWVAGWIAGPAGQHGMTLIASTAERLWRPCNRIGSQWWAMVKSRGVSSFGGAI